jgi:hypothetical protein
VPRTATKKHEKSQKVRGQGKAGKRPNWPFVSGLKFLKGNLKGKCRLRTGDYRLQFEPHELRVTVKEERQVKGKTKIVERIIVHYRIVIEKAGHRDGFYDE